MPGRKHIGSVGYIFGRDSGGIQIRCLGCSDYEPPADATPLVQKAAFRQHRLDMGENPAPLRKPVSVSLLLDEAQEFTKRCAQDGKTPSQVLRELVEGYLHRQPAPTDIGFYRDLRALTGALFAAPVVDTLEEYAELVREIAQTPGVRTDAAEEFLRRNAPEEVT